MTKYGRYSLMGVATVALAVAGCTTEDPRGSINDPFFANAELPKGNGELCEETSDCAGGFSCYEGTCTPDGIVAVCEPNPCGDGLCNARASEGGSDFFAFCRCPSGSEWDGATCVQDVAAPWPGTVTPGTTCPEELLVPDQPELGPNPDTADCPDNPFTFCTAASGGNCLEVFVDLAGTVDGSTVAVSVTGGSALTDAECIREYNEVVEGEDVTSDGVQLVLTGALAQSFADGATEVVIDVSNFDAVGGGSIIVWPQADAPPPEDDAGFVNVTVSGALGDFSEPAVGGEFTVTSVSGPDADEDGLIDDGEGLLGADFYLGFADGSFIGGAFTVQCGDNVIVTPDE